MSIRHKGSNSLSISKIKNSNSVLVIVKVAIVYAIDIVKVVIV